MFVACIKKVFVAYIGPLSPIKMCSIEENNTLVLRVRAFVAYKNGSNHKQPKSYPGFHLGLNLWDEGRLDRLFRQQS